MNIIDSFIITNLHFSLTPLHLWVIGKHGLVMANISIAFAAKWCKTCNQLAQMVTVPTLLWSAFGYLVFISVCKL